MLGELLHLLRALEKRSASAAVTDSIAHRLANPASIINSIQRGTISPAAYSSGTATITSVNTAKAVIGFLGASTASSGHTGMGRVELTNATTVTAYGGTLHNDGGGAAGSATVGYQVTEYK